MKKVLLAMMLLVVSMTAFAQRGGGDRTPEQRAENQTKLMTEKLGLSEKQQKQVYTLNLNRGQKMQALRESQNREGMRAEQENFRKELSAILTPDQQEKYKAMQQEMRQRGRLDRGPKSGQRGIKEHKHGAHKTRK
ncbi:DUF4890 domain-containing protein [Telluribacter sp.]|jgi:hypothetical protein|uniref:DUF4890 domain-containing protein n=1 Tax=Telluribacter sp. TaxID=1978767 RepID=UPI002E1381EC|nr:DUF4890 domain-containing protein [Telluribacter sp.]